LDKIAILLSMATGHGHKFRHQISNQIAPDLNIRNGRNCLQRACIAQNLAEQILCIKFQTNGDNVRGVVNQKVCGCLKLKLNRSNPIRT